MTKLDKVKKVIKEYYLYASCGIFDCRNFVGDELVTIYNEDDVQIDICYYYSYFEVFGLTNEEFEEIEEFYDSLDSDEEVEESEDEIIGLINDLELIKSLVEWDYPLTFQEILDRAINYIKTTNRIGERE